MPRAVTPRAAPFTVDQLGWRFVDMRDLEDRPAALERVQARRNAHLRRFYQGVSDYDGVDLCDLDQRTINAVSRRFRRAREQNPLLTWDEFELAGGTLVHDGCQDPRKHMLNYAVRDLNADRWIGGVHLGNFEIERDEDGNLTATCFFWSGLPNLPGMNLAQSWVRIMRYFIRNDITLANGRVVDIVGFNFLGEPWFRWRRTLNPRLGPILADLTPDVDEENDASDADIIRRIRRKGA